MFPCPATWVLVLVLIGAGPRETEAFAGPAGSFFSDGRYLYSVDEDNLSRWDVSDGSRTGYFRGFKPTGPPQGTRNLYKSSMMHLLSSAGYWIRVRIAPSNHTSSTICTSS